MMYANFLNKPLFWGVPTDHMSSKRWVKVTGFFAMERVLDVTQNVYSVGVTFFNLLPLPGHY